jgi:hypothetical protein
MDRMLTNEQKQDSVPVCQDLQVNFKEAHRSLCNLSLFLNSLWYWRGGFNDIITIQEQLQAALVRSEHRISANTSNISAITGLASSHRGSPLKGTEEWRVNAVIREKKVLCRNYFMTSRTAIDMFYVRYLV